MLSTIPKLKHGKALAIPDEDVNHLVEFNIEWWSLIAPVSE